VFLVGNSSQESSGMMQIPVAPPGATMAIDFQSDEEVLKNFVMKKVER
jgi:hypothetical protein